MLTNTSEALQYLNSVTAANCRLGQVINSCPLTQINGGLTRLHEGDDDAVNWLKTMTATALGK